MVFFNSLDMASSGSLLWDKDIIGYNNHNDGINSTSQMFESNNDYNGEIFSSICSVECMEAANRRIVESEDESFNRVGVSLKKLRSLGLVLQITQSFLELVHREVNNYNHRVSNHLNQSPSKVYDSEKLKAANFNPSLIKIGSWQRVSRPGNELVAKCYFAKRKLLWEILENCLKYKIEIPWSDIIAIRAHIKENQPGTLEIELKEKPSFYKELNPQPRRHTLWKIVTDFTGGQASLCRRHYLEFPPGVLNKHYEKLLANDPHLFELSNKGFPSLPLSPYFSQKNFGPPDFSYFNSNPRPIRPNGLQFGPTGPFSLMPSPPFFQPTPPSISDFSHSTMNYNMGTFDDPKIGGSYFQYVRNLANNLSPIQPPTPTLYFNTSTCNNKETHQANNFDSTTTTLRRIEQCLINDSETEACNNRDTWHDPNWSIDNNEDFVFIDNNDC